jgi:cytoskeleton protein RodZ
MLTDATDVDDPSIAVEAPVGRSTNSLLGDLVESLELPEGQQSAAATSHRVSTTLQREREARGLTLTDAAKATCIWERYLRALEADAPLEQFPAPAYARFFLRGYAEFLGLDQAHMLREFDESHSIEESPALQILPDPRPRRRVLAGVLAVASIVALLAIFVLDAVGDRETEAARSPVAPVSTASFGPDPSAARPMPPPARGVRAVLLLSQACWVQAVADGRTIESSTLQPGDRVVLRAHRLLELTLGNAGAVDLEVNGEGVATGALGNVVSIELRWRDGDVVSKIV